MVKTSLNTFLAFVVTLTVVHLLALLAGVWLPDLATDTPRTLASSRLAAGDEFNVVQYWNHYEFYTTELRHTTAEGRLSIRVLDGDDRKGWRVPLAVDAQNRTAAVTLSGGRHMTVPW